jgi:hypothetical protein
LFLEKEVKMSLYDGRSSPLAIKKAFADEIARGEQGLNLGLPMGFKRLSEYVCNVQKARYDLWGGGTGTGKSAIVMNAYVVNPINYLLSTNNTEISYKVKLFNMELPTNSVIAKLLANYIWVKSNRKILFSVNKIFSRSVIISKEEKQLIKDAYAYIDRLLEYVDIYEGNVSANYIYKVLIQEALSSGTSFTRPEETLADGTIIEAIKPEDLIDYKPNKPDSYVIPIIDHIGLLKLNKEDVNLKGAIDRLSSTLIKFRNRCKFSPVVVSQFNRSIEGMDRKKHVDPQLSDFKETGNPAQDADTVFSCFYPKRHRLEEHNGYSMSKYGNFYRGLTVLKNRDGRDNLDLPVGFIGAIGHVKELPLPEELEQNPKLETDILNYFNVRNV